MQNSPFLPKNGTLITQRLVLRPLCENDRNDCARILENSEIKKTYMLPDFHSSEDVSAFFERLRNLSEDILHYFYGIFFCDKLIGFINDVEIDDKSIEVGYVIHPDYHNNGFATEALRSLTAELFRMGFHCVKCGYFQGNEASRRVMVKSGMRKIDYEDDIAYRGELRHCLYYAIEKTDTSIEK